MWCFLIILTYFLLHEALLNVCHLLSICPSAKVLAIIQSLLIDLIMLTLLESSVQFWDIKTLQDTLTLLLAMTCPSNFTGDYVVSIFRGKDISSVFFRNCIYFCRTQMHLPEPLDHWTACVHSMGDSFQNQS